MLFVLFSNSVAFFSSNILFSGGDLTRIDRGNLLNSVTGEVIELQSSDSLSDQRCLQQLQLAANTTIWQALCQHAKMNMKEDFRIWLNESRYTDFIARAMDQANEDKYSNSLQFKAEFKTMVDGNHDPIALQKFLKEKPDLVLLVLKYKVAIV